MRRVASASDLIPPATWTGTDDLPHQAVDQVPIAIVAVGGGVEVDDVEDLGALLHPALGPADRVVVEGDGVFEPPSGQAHRAPTQDVDAGIQIHHGKLAIRDERGLPPRNLGLHGANTVPERPNYG